MSKEPTPEAGKKLPEAGKSLLRPDMTRAEAFQSLRTHLANAQNQAREQGLESDNGDPAREARMLLAAALDIPETALISDPARPVNGSEAARIAQFAARRLAGEPIARILGEWEFWGLPFALSADTLIPRPDSETLIEAALKRLDSTGQRRERLRILDLGTGSGCLLIAMLHECPLATGVGVDQSADAISTAQANARRNHVASRVLFALGDWADGIEERFDLVLSNPPYIATPDIATLAPGVRQHEPLAALNGGSDGLVFYRRLAHDLPRLLAPEGFAIIETGYDQGTSVPDLMTSAGLVVDAVCHDLAGHPRAVVLSLASPRL